MRQTLKIEGALSGINEWTNAIRSNIQEGARLKRRNQDIVIAYIKKSGLKPVTCKQDFTFVFIEKFQKRGRARDKDNISGGGHKFILDALVEAGILPDDGWKWVGNIHDQYYRASQEGGILVEMEDSTEKEGFARLVD